MSKVRDNDSTQRVATSRVIDTTGTALYEEIIDLQTGETFFIDKNGMTYESLEMGDTHYVPIPEDDSALKAQSVKLPSDTIGYGITKDLIREIQAHIHTYVEVSPQYETLASWYVLLSHIYDQVYTIPYLRALGDTGTGKTRFQDVIGGLCYKPMFISGAVTPAPIYRMIERWGGTMIIDEADLYKSNETNEIITILNCGNQRGRAVMRCQKDNPDKIQHFSTYGPKIIATRQTFTDKALESRCLTEIMKQCTRQNIPINLPRKFYTEELTLRNKLLKWRLDHWTKIDPDKAQEIDLGINLEPRLRQVMGYFPLLFYENPKMMTYFKETLQVMNKDLIEERATSFDGMIVTLLLKFYDEGHSNITPGEISKQMRDNFGLERVTPQSIGRHLKSLGIKTRSKTIEGKTQRLIVWDDALISRLRDRYQLRDDADKITEITKITDVWGVNGTKSNLLNKEKEKDKVGGTPQGNVINVTNVIDQKERIEAIRETIRKLDKGNGAPVESVFAGIHGVFRDRTEFNDYIKQLIQAKILFEPRTEHLRLTNSEVTQ